MKLDSIFHAVERELTLQLNANTSNATVLKHDRQCIHYLSTQRNSTYTTENILSVISSSLRNQVETVIIVVWQLTRMS